MDAHLSEPIGLKFALGILSLFWLSTVSYMAYEPERLDLLALEAVKSRIVADGDRGMST